MNVFVREGQGGCGRQAGRALPQRQQVQRIDAACQALTARPWGRVGGGGVQGAGSSASARGARGAPGGQVPGQQRRSVQHAGA